MRKADRPALKVWGAITVALIAVAMMFGATVELRWASFRSPDPATGHLFPYEVHGVRYFLTSTEYDVSQWGIGIFIVAWVNGAVFALTGGVRQLWRQWRHGGD